ncbi:hypothetical protein BJ912DRAFT_1095103 [Pholiota molesta]|nr:hypothetical protein BJ912DRAFT_1095103 [Pholiota molesta]
MFSPSLVSFVLNACLIGTSLGVTITQSSQLKTHTYDYIIVGAGTAGLTLANRLTEDPKVTVLVLEAGISDEGQALVTAPFLAPTITPNTILDWNYTVVPQVGLNNRDFPYPRGRLLGGSSSINYLFHQYGSTEDWDRFARVTGDPGWAWSNMRQFVSKVFTMTSRFTSIPSHAIWLIHIARKNCASCGWSQTTGQFIPSIHGFNGVMGISLPGFNESTDTRVMQTTGQLPSEFPYNEDMSGVDRSLLGLGFVPGAVNGGVRSSSSTSYLAQANSRPNLTVLINSTVQKVIETGSILGIKVFKSVQFTSSPGTSFAPGGSPSVQVNATKEVILSAGSIGTTQILQLSGIGNPDDLNPLKIQVLINSPKVGRNLMDHTFLPNIFSVNGETSLDHVLQDSNSINAVVNQFFTNHTGMIAAPVSNTFGFARIPANSTALKGIPDPAPGPNSPHFEYIPTNFFISAEVPEPATGSFFTIVTVLVNPTSRGTVKIRSTNPFDKPIIDPRFLTTDFDVAVMRESVKSTRRFVSAPAWADYVIGPIVPGLDTDDEIDNFVRTTTTTIFHPSGTAGMAAFNSSNGVVNPDLSVKGTLGLRVVDASVFPFIPSSHTQGPVYMVAERASQIIKLAGLIGL